MPRPASTSRRRGLRGERGLALPVVMATLILMLIFLATAASRAGIGLSVSRNDVASKRALQTATAGLRVAIYRANALGLDLNQLLKPTQQCLITTTGLLSLTGGSSTNWCPPVTEDLGTGASFSYRMSPVVGPGVGGLLGLLTLPGTYPQTLSRRIVSSGTVDGVTRRVYAEVSASGSITVTLGIPLLGIPNLVSSGNLQLYRVTPGTFRECSGQPVTASTPSPPDTGC